MQNVSSQVDVRPGHLLDELRIYPPDQVPLQVETDGDDFGTESLPAAVRPSPRMIERPGPSVGRKAVAEAPPVDAPVPRMIEPARTGPVSPPATPVAPVAPAGPESATRTPAAPVAPAPRPLAAASPTNRTVSDPATPSLEIEDGETTLFEAAIGAFHAGEFHRAESLFLEEAEGSVDVAPQRAAIAFRQAALAAKQAGNMDGSDHWMRLAGREYLKVSEDDRTPLPFIREAALMAAKCFLSVENLHVASKGLRRAQAIESVLGADDDLMADAPGIPFRHGDAAPAPVAGTDRPGAGPSGTDRPGAGPSGIERRSPDSVGAGLRAGAPATRGAATATRRPGWIRRLRPDHAGHGAA